MSQTLVRTRKWNSRRPTRNEASKTLRKALSQTWTLAEVLTRKQKFVESQDLGFWALEAQLRELKKRDDLSARLARPNLILIVVASVAFGMILRFAFHCPWVFVALSILISACLFTDGCEMLSNFLARKASAHRTELERAVMKGMVPVEWHSIPFEQFAVSCASDRFVSEGRRAIRSVSYFFGDVRYTVEVARPVHERLFPVFGDILRPGIVSIWIRADIPCRDGEKTVYIFHQ